MSVFHPHEQGVIVTSLNQISDLAKGELRAWLEPWLQTRGTATPVGTGGGGTTGPAGGDLAGSYPNPQIAVGVITDVDVNAANKDGLAAAPSLRTLGSGAQQAAAGNDARFSDARAPTGTAGGDLSGTYPNPLIRATYAGQSSITTLGTITTGVWNGSAVPVGSGGTGQATAKLARETGLGAAGYYSNAATHGAGTTITITQATHGLRASRGILVQVQHNATGAVELPDVVVAASGDVTITYAAAVAANSKLVTLIG